MSVLHAKQSDLRLKVGNHVAEVPVNFENLGPDWDFVIGPADLGRIERMRLALKSDNAEAAGRGVRVFELHPVAAQKQ